MRTKTVATAAAVTLGALLVAGLAAPAQAAELPDVQVTVSFDKRLVAVGDKAVETITVKNAGKADAHNVKVLGDDGAGFKGLTPWSNKPFELKAGETRVIKIDGEIVDEGYGGIVYHSIGFGADGGDANDEDNIDVARMGITGLKGHVGVRVYHEADGNTDTIEDESVPGVKVEVLDPTDKKVLHTGVTDTKGVYRVEGLQVGEYLVRFTSPAGWKVTKPEIERVVGNGGGGEQPIAATKVAVTPTPSPSASPSPAAGGLPVTGSNAALVAGAGAGVLALGAVLFVVARRRRTFSA
ncbi:SdrD B-like domain-containing protein [Longispora sp. NPDC051575]|uniref:SdrD B-like domain-containing protein n=1 Tax=Longispora sp. NPDC051575 TaxID=3154943 RepID=UPI00343DA32F